MVLPAMIVAAALAGARSPRSGEVAAGIGVEVRLQNKESSYDDLPRVLGCLSYLGVHAVRDAAPRSMRQLRDSYLPLARAGVRFDFVLEGDPAAQRRAQALISDLERAAPGAVLSVEGAEIAGPSALSGGSASAVTGASRLLRVQPADTQQESRGGVGAETQPNGENPAWIDVGLGYATSPAQTDHSERAQARRLLVHLLEDVAHGVSGEYVFELLDASSDASTSDPRGHRGLFNHDYSPKLAARMIHLLNQILDEPAASALPVKLGDLSWSGARTDLHTVSLNKADGEIDAVFWRDLGAPDLPDDSDPGATSYPVDVRLPEGRGRVVVNDPAAALRGEVRSGVRVTRLWVGADPIILQVLPPATGRTT